MRGDLYPIEDCWLQFGDGEKMPFYALPELQESKSVSYADQPIQGRAAPVKTYSYSENRTFGLTIHMYVTKTADIARNLGWIRKVAALAHPEYNGTYLPPRVARLRCGNLLGKNPNGEPVVLKSYDISYDNSVQWYRNDDGDYMPLHVAISTQWDVVYSWSWLPGQADVMVGSY